jgi:hypothetical protein
MVPQLCSSLDSHLKRVQPPPLVGTQPLHFISTDGPHSPRASGGLVQVTVPRPRVGQAECKPKTAPCCPQRTAGALQSSVQTWLASDSTCVTCRLHCSLSRKEKAASETWHHGLAEFPTSLPGACALHGGAAGAHCTFQGPFRRFALYPQASCFVGHVLAHRLWIVAAIHASRSVWDIYLFKHPEAV